MIFNQEEIKSVLDAVFENYKSKNETYGNNFFQVISGHGIPAGFLPITQKITKMDTLIKHGAAKGNIKKVIIDLATYLAMFYVGLELPEKVEEKTDSPIYDHANIHCSIKKNTAGELGFGMTYHLYKDDAVGTSLAKQGEFSAKINSSPKSPFVFTCLTAIDSLFGLIDGKIKNLTIFAIGDPPPENSEEAVLLETEGSKIGKCRFFPVEEDQKNEFSNRADFLAEAALKNKKEKKNAK